MLRASLFTALVLGACAVHAGTRVETEIPWVPESRAVAPRAQAAAERIRNVRLEAPAAEKLAMPARRAGVPMQVGFGRPVEPLRAFTATAAQLDWQPLATGARVAALSVTSPGAAALRLGLAVEALPTGARLRFYRPHDAQAFETGAAQIERLATWWSPVVEGETIVMEIEVPPGADPNAVRIAGPALSHLVTSAERNFALPKAASACTLDASCHQGAWAEQSAATARIVFTRNGATFVCTGTLLADEDPGTHIPYFLTANHCISTQAEASTIVSYWFLRASECNSGTPGPYRSLQGGAVLLYATGATDTSFLRLNATPPAGAAYAGWLVGSDPAPNAPVRSYHHARGDLQKVSLGVFAGGATCDPPNGAEFDCFPAPLSQAPFYYARWGADGITEQGSSGAGLFVEGGRYLIGQLYGGDGTCTDPATDVYGRFDVAYNDRLRSWLSAPAQGPGFTPAHDYSDLWWNSAESGWGVSITQHPSRQIFAAWYVYGADGRPLWVVMSGGQWTSERTFTGDLYTTTGPDPRGPFDPREVVVTRAGSGTFTFDSSGAGSLAYTVNGVQGTRAITRQPFGPPDGPAPANYNDLWWNPQESGWGVSINQQNRTLFAVWYAYGPDNRPVWYVMSGGTWTGDTVYTGALYRTVRPPSEFFGNVRFDPSSVSVAAVGSLTFTFQGTNAATMAYTVDGVSGTKSITRQSF